MLFNSLLLQYFVIAPESVTNTGARLRNVTALKDEKGKEKAACSHPDFRMFDFHGGKMRSCYYCMGVMCYGGLEELTPLLSIQHHPSDVQ